VRIDAGMNMDYASIVGAHSSTGVSLLKVRAQDGAQHNLQRLFSCPRSMAGAMGALPSAPDLVPGKANPVSPATLSISLDGGGSRIQYEGFIMSQELSIAPEEWRDIPGYEGRYRVSNLGRVKSVPFMQRYLLKTGKPAFRKTAEKIISQQETNSGYLVCHLHLDNKRNAVTVHKLVVSAFFGLDSEKEINHKNGIKADNRACNLEQITSSENKIHAVHVGLNRQAKPVIGISKSGGIVRFKSAAEADEHYTGKRTGSKVSACCRGKRNSAYGFTWVYADA